MNKTLYKQIFKTIKSFQNIVIARHIGVDPDAMASQMALKRSIEETFNVLGFSYNGSLKPKTKINENYVIEKLEALFPNKVISHIDHHSTLGKNILKLSE